MRRAVTKTRDPRTKHRQNKSFGPPPPWSQPAPCPGLPSARRAVPGGFSVPRASERHRTTTAARPSRSFGKTTRLGGVDSQVPPGLGKINRLDPTSSGLFFFPLPGGPGRRRTGILSHAISLEWGPYTGRGVCDARTPPPIARAFRYTGTPLSLSRAATSKQTNSLSVVRGGWGKAGVASMWNRHLPPQAQEAAAARLGQYKGREPGRTTNTQRSDPPRPRIGPASHRLDDMYLWPQHPRGGEGSETC